MFAPQVPATPRPLLVRKVIEALHAIILENKQAGLALEKLFRQSKQAGSSDRAFIAETTYEILRYYRFYCEVLGISPRDVADLWKITGAYFALSDKYVLPDWTEYKFLNAEELRQKAASVEPIRAVRESIPEWMDTLAATELGADWDETLRWLNKPAEVVLRTNTLKTNRENLLQKLESELLECRPEGEADAVVLTKRKNVFSTASFKEGLFEVQDYSSQQVAPFLDVKPGQRVVDACAGGGGKTLHLAALLQNKGAIIALDTLAWKLDELRIRARRAGISNIETRVIESTKTIKRLHGTADRLLLDVPCSGLGVLRRNPDSKWKLSPEFIDNLKSIQAEILQSYSAICKAGGKMVYATCSILPSENEQQVAAFLASENGKKFKFIEDRHILPQTLGYDGFYMALMERI